MSVTFERAVVVGASSGIGAAIARELLASGARVALIARRGAELASVVASLPETERASASVFVHDVTDFDETSRLFDRIVADLGGLDLLVYAAGVMPKIAEGEYAFDKDREMIEVNLLGAMAWMNLAAARFEAASAGTIVGISSIAGERGRRNNPGYCASKAALTTYLEALRNRVSRAGVNVVTIKPGFVDTRMTRGSKGLFWLVSPGEAAATSLGLARRGAGADAFVPARWAIVAAIVRAIPSFLFRRLNV
jgi:short-subunit dehydrogenase